MLLLCSSHRYYYVVTCVSSFRQKRHWSLTETECSEHELLQVSGPLPAYRWVILYIFIVVSTNRRNEEVECVIADCCTECFYSCMIGWGHFFYFFWYARWLSIAVVEWQRGPSWFRRGAKLKFWFLDVVLWRAFSQCTRQIFFILWNATSSRSRTAQSFKMGNLVVNAIAISISLNLGVATWQSGAWDMSSMIFSPVLLVSRESSSSSLKRWFYKKLAFDPHSTIKQIHVIWHGRLGSILVVWWLGLQTIIKVTSKFMSAFLAEESRSLQSFYYSTLRRTAIVVIVIIVSGDTKMLPSSVDLEEYDCCSCQSAS